MEKAEKYSWIRRWVLFLYVIAFLNMGLFLFEITGLASEQWRAHKCQQTETIEIEEYLGVLVLIQEDKWSVLDQDDKIYVLQTIANIETYEAGLYDCPEVILANMPDKIVGQYVPSNNEIHINEDYFMRLTSRELVSVICHECHHHMTMKLTEAFNSLPEEFKNMEAFAYIRTYSYEYENYYSNGTEYFNQSVEYDAQCYSDQRTNYYFEIIENYTVSENKG